jgi:adenylate cyclase
VIQATEALKRKEKYYMEQYGVSPTFKAGIHAGHVTAGYIGIIKKDLVFSGDTLNTSARIRSKCHDLGEEFVISIDFMHDFEHAHEYNIKEIGEMEFKGRKEKSKLFAFRFD